MTDFVKYMNMIEQRMLIPGMLKGLYTRRIKAPIRSQKLQSTKFGEFVGPIFDTSAVMVIDYYGLLKKSTGLMERVGELERQGFEIKSATVPVAFFSEVKLEQLSEFSPALVPSFLEFKEHLVKLRGFPSNGEG